MSNSANTSRVIGIYGLPGSGKTTILKYLKDHLPEDQFLFFEGSEVIDHLHPARLSGFKKGSSETQYHWRTKAIEHIQQQCIEAKRTGIVTGHLMFWPESLQAEPEPICTSADMENYNHIVYLDVDAEEIERRRKQDFSRNRDSDSLSHLEKWKETEKKLLRKLCRKHGIQFVPVSGEAKYSEALIEGFLFQGDEERNSGLALARLDSILDAYPANLESMFVVDGDKTLAAQDTGNLLWQLEFGADGPSQMRKIFENTGHTETSFRHLMSRHCEIGDNAAFDMKCRQVASQVTIHPEFMSLLGKLRDQAKSQRSLGAMVLTCGLEQIWQKVLENAGLSDVVKVIGAGRDIHSFVVTPETKRAIVSHLQSKYRLKVWAFGDSPIDIYMLCEANHAFVIAGDEASRSKSMETELQEVIGDGSLLRARQVQLPGDSPLRLDATQLPVLQLTEIETVIDALDFVHATDIAATKLLMGPMRDASVHGNALREAHRRVGAYLSTHFVGDVVGLETYPIAHVQPGKSIEAHRLLDEENTVIVPLMRGGEPMAFGVSDAFPLAAFVHAKEPDQLQYEHFKDRKTTILVDAVVNTGKSIAEFIEHIRALHPTIRIVVIAGVVQKEAVLEGSLLQKTAGRHGKVTLVALRLSDDKYTGKGTTDTGNRLFNTTDLD